jgi:hypothetical protein
MQDDDPFSNFKSAIEWPDMRPPNEEATGGFVPLSHGFRAMLETCAYATTIAADCESEIEIDLGGQVDAAPEPARRQNAEAGTSTCYGTLSL